MSGLLVASPMSGSGKTTFTLGLLRALRNKGIALAPGKAGPDYIDPAFHAAASGEACLNFDPWGMRQDLLRANAGLALSGQRLLVIEAMMGLYDGAADGTGSAAELAVGLNLPVLFVVNCQKMSHSIAALVRGFSEHDPNVMIAGVVLNNVASSRHEAMLRVALDKIGIRVVCVLYRDETLEVPERHLGLVQAGEHQALEQFIEQAAFLVEQSCNLDDLLAMASSLGNVDTVSNIDRLPPPGQRVAVARDLAFAFCYEHMLLGWRRRGADIRFFSPLADEAPPEDADSIYLPGGYPELYAERLSQAAVFKSGVVEAANRDVPVYGECGGYMVLGDGLVDASGRRHQMLGLLPLTTSFEQRKLHLGYRRLVPRPDYFWPMALTAHEFHYATVVEEGQADHLFEVKDALGHPLAPVGQCRGSVSGSFMHVIDAAACV